MTENEAIEVMKANYPKCCKMVDGRLKGGFDDTECELGQAFTTGIKALEEIQQYRAIDTVEECKIAVERMKAKIEVGDIVCYAQTKEKAVVICQIVDGKKCKVMFDDFDIATVSYDELTQTGEQINLKEMLK